MSPAHFILPLIAALLYVTGALIIKRATELGAGAWRTTFICNIALALSFQPLLLLGGKVPSASLLWQPAIVALIFLLGQVFTFISLDRGDVSIATPVMGIKIILVAILTTLLIGDPLSVKLWTAAGLSTAAVALLNRTKAGAHHHVGTTILTASLAALAYALFDVLVQKWSPAWGAGRFLPVMLGFLALYNLLLPKFFRAPLSGITREAWRWLLGGAIFFALQSVVFVTTIAVFGKATSANVIYSSRGLWSVLAVWLVGHWFKNREQNLGAEILRWRLAGAVLLMVAIVLVMV